MGLFQKLRRHAAIATGNFNTMFKGIEIPPLPLAVQRLLAEINNEDPDIDRLATLISSATGISAKVIQTVNSSFYSPRSPVSEIKQAVTFLGIKNIRSLVMAYSVMDAIPRPTGDIFDHEAFWIDSLVRAFFSRSMATVLIKDKAEEAFTASLISDVALPVLLSVWSEYYTPIMAEWSQSPERLSRLEREHFGWDHAQAGAWIVQSWGFPDELVCYIGAHNLSMDEIRKLELTDTIVVPMAASALWSSVLKQDPDRIQTMHTAATQLLGISTAEVVQMITHIKAGLDEVLLLFGLTNRGVGDALDQLAALAESTDQEQGE
ncbi:MAG: HDOD domain-containing protein [Desulfobacteraceae bacterium]|nr:HDOD domain-containing protein [Desulfobacteraceae bacterium]